jgi:hypothetical protein
MASSKVETAIVWSAAASVTLSSNNAWSVSDAIAFNVEDWDGEVVVYVDNAGTPASGDTVTVGILYSDGNVDGSAGDDYVNVENYEFLALLDTYNNQASGGIVSRTVPVRTANKGFKLCVSGPQVASRNIVARAALITHRAQ